MSKNKRCLPRGPRKKRPQAEFDELTLPEFSLNYDPDLYEEDEKEGRALADDSIRAREAGNKAVERNVAKLLVSIDELRRAWKVQTFKKAKSPESPLHKLFRFLIYYCRQLHAGSVKLPEIWSEKVEENQLDIDLAIMVALGLPRKEWEFHKETLCGRNPAKFLECMLTLNEKHIERIWLPRAWFPLFTEEWTDWVKHDRGLKSRRPKQGPLRDPKTGKLARTRDEANRILPGKRVPRPSRATIPVKKVKKTQARH